MLSCDFGVTLSPKEFEQRFVNLHKQLFSSTEFSFQDVVTHILKPVNGMAQFDHSFIFDGQNWHLYYGTGDMKLSEEWIKHFRTGSYDRAAEVCLEPGNGHAVGPELTRLQFVEHVFFPPQGRFDMASRGVCSLFKYGPKYGMLYDVRGENFIGMSLAWSDDLYKWELDQDNPCLTYPQWATPRSECKDPHIIYYDGLYLIYYIVMDKEGYCSIALATTADWKTFTDEGCVFKSAPMLRGTMGIESPCVVNRDGMWHLFFTYGPGVWHAVGISPTKFVSGRGDGWSVGTGFYYMGPFHATEVIQGPDGQWWMTTDRKEQNRMLNRQLGKLCYRGTYEDETVLEEGMYLSRLDWKGDQPVLKKPGR